MFICCICIDPEIWQHLISKIKMSNNAPCCIVKRGKINQFWVWREIGVIWNFLSDVWNIPFGKWAFLNKIQYGLDFSILLYCTYSLIQKNKLLFKICRKWGVKPIGKTVVCIPTAIQRPAISFGNTVSRQNASGFSPGARKMLLDFRILFILIIL